MMRKTVTTNKTLPLAITMGEPAGIGPEVVIKSWLKRAELSLPAFYVIGDEMALLQTAETLGVNLPLRECQVTDVIEAFGQNLPVLAGSKPISGQIGKPSPDDGEAICSYIRQAVDNIKEGSTSGMVTAPINKLSLYQAGFEFPGHTEFLAALSEQIFNIRAHPVMMLAGPQLRTVPVTIHIPLNRVPDTLTSELILNTIEITHHDLIKRFGVARPRLAVSGLNPHAGEGGAMGKEDEAIIAPAIRQAREHGINALGPLPADTMFHEGARQSYDVAICMYHDQALIPAKTLAFDDAVNVTLGLPFIRTSPDHGTALDIAGKGLANPSSMIAAIKMAGAMAEKASENAN